MSLDQVAQQLKLTPRQVKALEDQDFARLPGRTFTRGFVRNYARLLNLDAGGLLAALPDAVEAPALDRPALQATGAMIAELPATRARGPGLARWLIPLLLVGCVIAAAAYEWYGGGLSTPRDAQTTATPKGEPSIQGASPQATTSTALPNPLAGASRTEPAAASSAGENAAAQAPAEAVATSAAAAPAPSAAASAPSVAAATAAPAEPPAVASAAPVAQSAPAIAEAKPAAGEAGATTLLLTYRGSSWTRIRDRNGNVLISRTVPSGTSQSLRGVPPFDITIGNANMVTLLYRGEPVDLARFTAHNVARLRLS
jgi:cytoskeleton protein RodZ